MMPINLVLYLGPLCISYGHIHWPYLKNKNKTQWQISCVLWRLLKPEDNGHIS